MKKNLGDIDRIVRAAFALAVAVLILTETLTGTAGLLLGIVGGVLLVTSFVGLCPLYLLLGISTRKSKPAVQV